MLRASVVPVTPHSRRPVATSEYTIGLFVVTTEMIQHVEWHPRRLCARARSTRRLRARARSTRQLRARERSTRPLCARARSTRRPRDAFIPVCHTPDLHAVELDASPSPWAITHDLASPQLHDFELQLQPFRTIFTGPSALATQHDGPNPFDEANAQTCADSVTTYHEFRVNCNTSADVASMVSNDW